MIYSGIAFNKYYSILMNEPNIKAGRISIKKGRICSSLFQLI